MNMPARRALIVSAAAFVFVYSAPASATAAAPAGATACSGCHAAAAGVVSPVARLVGMGEAEIVKAMQEFRAGKRPATVMDRIARGFTDGEIQAIAEWYARQR
jgi:sulfide dehydrogenase cytochrome subunit